MESGNPLLDDYVLGLTGRSGRASASCRRRAATPTTTSSASTRPSRPTAASRRTSRCSGATAAASESREHLLSQDLIYVGGGSVISLLGVWRAHGLDTVLREAWERGIVLCGVSAGSLCWFAEGITGFHGAPERFAGLGLLGCSNTVHYETERGARGRLPGRAARRHAARLRGKRRHRRSTSRAAPAARRLVALRGARVQDAERARARDQDRARVAYLGDRAPAVEARPARRRAPSRMSATAGASSRWAAAASPRRSPTRRSSTTWRACRPPSTRRSACCPPRAATPTSRSTASTARSAAARAALAPLAVPARHPPGGPARAPARPGRDLRRRREPREPARDLARARARRDAARGVGARHRALRRERRLDVLVRARDHALPRALAPGRRALGCFPAATPSTTRATRSAGPATRRPCSTGSRPATRWTTASGLLFAGTDLVEVVSAREHARAHRIEERGGRLVETPLVPRLLEPVAVAGQDAPVEIAEFRDARRAARGARAALAPRLM